MDSMPLVQQFKNAIDDVIARFNDQGLNVAEAMGALEMVKLDIWESIISSGEDEE